MSSSNSKRIQNTESQETEKNTEKEVEDIILDNISAIKKLYPSLSIEGKIRKSLLLSNEEMSIFKRNKPSFLKDENDNSDLLSDNFLKELIKKPCPLDRNKIITVMTEFIQKSPLIQKFQKDAQMDKKVENNELSKMGAENLSYMELKKGQVLFRIGDNGDRFYFILAGRISILKLKEINNVKMNYFEYLDYCMHLITQKEYYIFNKVKNRNMKIISLSSESDVISIYKIFFMKKLKEAILGDLVPDTKSLIKYLKQFGFKLQDFNIKISGLEKIENNSNLNSEFKREEWNDYLINKCQPTFSDLMVYEHYKHLFEDDIEKKLFTCFIYKPFLFLGKGLFFGDFALDSNINKRNATIRAEENTILAFMKSSDYINIFAPGRRLEKMKEINFLYSNYFFRYINMRSFEKNYYHLFSPREFFRNYELFDFGSSLESLILLKEGKVSLEIKASIADLHDLIKYLWENIEGNKYFKTLTYSQRGNLISSSIVKRIQEYIDEPIFTHLKLYGDKFSEEINKLKTLQIYTFANKEIIGLEEFYLEIPYLMRGTVYGNKISCYKIDVENFENILMQEKQIVYQFVKSSVNKIISLIDRLQNLKINHIKMIVNKFENELLDFREINELSNGNINKSNVEFNNNKENRISLQKKYLNNKVYKSPVKIISTNLNPLVQYINLKRTNLNKKFDNISNLGLSTDKLTYISSDQNRKNDSLLNKYNSYVFKKINESNINSQLSKEEITSESNKKNSKIEKINYLSINSNDKIKNKIKMIFNSQRSFSYNNNNYKLNNILKSKNESLIGLSPKEKMTQKNMIIKDNFSALRLASEKKKIDIFRNYHFKKDKLKSKSVEKENLNEPLINSIWFRHKIGNLKQFKNISINENINRDNNICKENDSLMDKNEININNDLKGKEKMKKMVLSQEIKELYKRIKERGYSSLIRNQNSNTILNKKNKSKYTSNNSISISKSLDNQNINIKNKYNKIWAKLPLINDKRKIIFS